MYKVRYIAKPPWILIAPYPAFTADYFSMLFSVYIAELLSSQHSPFLSFKLKEIHLELPIANFLIRCSFYPRINN